MWQMNIQRLQNWDRQHTPVNIVAPFYGMRNGRTKVKKWDNQNSHFVVWKAEFSYPYLVNLQSTWKKLISTESGQLGINFTKHIRMYNSEFAFTSMGGRVDKSINCAIGHYVFRINGQNYHHIGSLLSEHGKNP